MPENATTPRAVGIWLAIGTALIGLMVIVGGITRLTGSGLSIAHWDIVTGTLPPMSETAWEEQFSHYKETPQYQLVNSYMGLHEFKSIFWWEYIHRLLGRLIGIIFVIPFLYFVIRKYIDAVLMRRLGLIFLLGLSQGILGWYMVKSGLIDVPWVSPYRLAAHLGLAFYLMGLTWITSLDVLAGRSVGEARVSDPWVRSFVVLVFIQIVLGGLVAGAKAGLIYSTFPLMGDRWIPVELSTIDLTHYLQEPVSLQFLHRIGGWLVALSGFILSGILIRRQPRLRGLASLLIFALSVQFLLGVLTIIYFVPLPLAVMHQAGAMGVFLTAVTLSKKSAS